MSSFGDNFNRNANENLNYDDFAFYTFASTFLIVFAIPLGISLLVQLFSSSSPLDTSKLNCSCKNCQAKYDSISRKRTRSKFGFSFFLKLVILIGLAFLITQSLKQIEENSHKMKTFNPYEELEVPETATPEEIKKAYKIMARKWHPDKNKQIEAKAKFILINKAYEVFL